MTTIKQILYTYNSILTKSRNIAQWKYSSNF